MAPSSFLLFLLFLLSPAASDVISVKPGEDVILSCRAAGGSIRVVEWTRTDLKSPEYVLFNRDGRTVPDNQHPSFVGRVQLVESDLKDGDASLILKNVNMNNTGTYECRVHQEDSGSHDMKTIRSFRLEVADLISKKPGDDVILPCQADDGSIRAVKWTRTDLEPAEDILHYTDGQSENPSHSRVQLVDSDLKKGDVSLILKKVNMDDRGTYECRVATGGSRRRKRAISNPEPIRRFRLEVTDSGGDPKHDGLAPGVVGVVVGVVAGVVVGVAVGAVFGVLVVRRSNRRKEQRSNPPAADESVNDDLI